MKEYCYGKSKWALEFLEYLEDKLKNNRPVIIKQIKGGKTNGNNR